MNSNVLGQILIEAEALTNKVKSTTDINYEDIPNECSNVDFLASHIKDLIIKAAIFPSKNVNTGNPSFDPINTSIPSNIVTNSMIPQASSNISNISDDSSIPSTSTTNSMISQTSSIKNNMYQNQSSSNISNVSDNTNIPSTSATNSSILETSSIQNTMNQNHMSPNMFGLSTTRYENSSNDKTILNAMPYIDNINREKEKQEQEALRKKYRNKYKYLDKYKNINEKNSTKDEKNNIKKPHFIDNKFINANESNSTKSCIKAFNDCRPYRDPIFDGIEDVELIYIEEGDTDPRRVIKSLSDIQPRVLIDLIDANSAEITEIKKRLMKYVFILFLYFIPSNLIFLYYYSGESKSRQNNSSQISDEKINSNKPNRKNVAINKKIKNDKQKRYVGF